MTMRDDGGRSLLLDPRFLIQLAGILLSFAGLYFGLVTKLDVAVAEQVRQGQALADIQKNLPNSEAEHLRFQVLKDQVEKNKAETDFSIAKLEKWKEETTVLLIKKGIL